jgi:hypothetical protein
MSESTEIVTWIALAVGCLSIGAGALALAGGKVLVLPWQRQRIRVRPWAWSQVLLGIFLLLETVPRLADASVTVVLGFSFGAAIPLLCAAPMLLDGTNRV